MAKNKKKQMPALPDTVFVKWSDEGGGEPYLLAFSTQEEAVEEDGSPSVVGTFECKSTDRLRLKTSVEKA